MCIKKEIKKEKCFKKKFDENIFRTNKKSKMCLLLLKLSILSSDLHFNKKKKRFKCKIIVF